jgi:hypothetical protein
VLWVPCGVFNFWEPRPFISLCPMPTEFISLSLRFLFARRGDGRATRRRRARVSDFFFDSSFFLLQSVAVTCVMLYFDRLFHFLS